MGGNAIKSSKRINKSEYDRIYNDFLKLFSEYHMERVQSYFSKEDFGDVDVVVEIIPNRNLKKEILDFIKPTEFYNNGNCLSILFEGAQLDLIFVKKENFNSFLQYLNFNDIGNLIGKVCHSLGFKYGTDGLSYEHHYNEHFKLTVPVTTDMKLIMEFLGYDYKKYANGFNDPNDIYSFVISSPYFNSYYFLLGNLNHIARIRDRKRKMYNGFLAYLKDHDITPKEKSTPEEKNNHLQRAIKFFHNGFEHEIEKGQQEFLRNQEMKQYFNGDIVSELTGLTNKSLGGFMQRIKSSEPNFKERVLEGKELFVEQLIKKHYAALSQNQ